VPSSRGSRKQGALKRQAGVARAKRRGAGELKGIDAALAKLRERQKAGETLSSAQLDLLRRHGFVE
jgi:hypothetical protein